MKSGGYWATATEEDLAREVVNTLMEVKEHRKSVSEDTLKKTSVAENQLVRPQRHSVSEFDIEPKHRTLSTSEEIKAQRAEIAKEIERVRNRSGPMERTETIELQLKSSKKKEKVDQKTDEKVEQKSAKKSENKNDKKENEKIKDGKGKNIKGKASKSKGSQDPTESKRYIFQ